MEFENLDISANDYIENISDVEVDNISETPILFSINDTSYDVDLSNIENKLDNISFVLDKFFIQHVTSDSITYYDENGSYPFDTPYVYSTMGPMNNPYFNYKAYIMVLWTDTSIDSSLVVNGNYFGDTVDVVYGSFVNGELVLNSLGTFLFSDTLKFDVPLGNNVIILGSPYDFISNVDNVELVSYSVTNSLLVEDTLINLTNNVDTLNSSVSALNFVVSALFVFVLFDYFSSFIKRIGKKFNRKDDL